MEGELVSPRPQGELVSPRSKPKEVVISPRPQPKEEVVSPRPQQLLEQQSPFDNEVSILYRYAVERGIPTKLILSIQTLERKIVLLNILEEIDRLLTEAPVMTITELYDYFKDLNPTASYDNIVMGYIGRRGEITKELLDEINAFYQGIEESAMARFPVDTALVEEYRGWLRKNTESLVEDKRRYDIIIGVQTSLAEAQPTPITPFQANHIILGFNPKFASRKVELEDGLDIFNEMLVNKYIPFVQYNRDDERYVKVFTGETQEQSPKFSYTIFQAKDVRNNNTIYFKLWIGDGDISLATEDSLRKVTYHLENNFLTLDVSLSESRTIDIVTQRLRSAFPSLDLGSPQEIGVRGVFSVPNFEINEVSFLHAILVEELFNIYLYVEESDKAYAFKKRLDIHYRSLFRDINEAEIPTDNPYISNSASLSMILTQNYPSYQGDTSSLTIAITRAESRKVIEEFSRVFSRLLTIYNQLRGQPDGIDAFYAKLIPESMNPRVIKKATTPSKEPLVPRRESKIDQLQNRHRHIFPDGYATICQCKQQPIIIDPGEIQEWGGKTFVKKGITQYHQIMPFPQTDPYEILVVCPEDKYPYPALRENNNLPNKNIYPFVPCCYERDYYDRAIGKFGIAKERQKTSKKAEKELSTDRFLDPGAVGSISRAINTIFRGFPSPVEGKPIVMGQRVGVIRTPNSLIHCLCVATSFPDYIKEMNLEGRERVVKTIRTTIANNYPGSLFKQELYDRTSDEIKEAILSLDTFFDPLIYYRGLEQFFKVNIATFALTADDTGELLIPRHRLFHIFSPNYQLPTVCILRNIGSRADVADYPQCELLIANDEQRSLNIRLFDQYFLSIITPIVKGVHQIYSWSPEKGNLIARSNLFTSYRLSPNVLAAASGQYIDDYGKCRGITIKVNTFDLSIITPPIQPINAPQISNSSMYRGSFDLVIYLFGSPSGKSIDSEENIDGFWYAFGDLQEGIYIPIVPISQLLLPYQLSIMAGNPLFSEAPDPIPRYQLLKKTVNLLLQIVQWVYLLAKRNNQEITVSQFATTYFGVFPPSEEDSLFFYPLEKVTRRLPDVNTPEEAITSIFSNNRILFHNREMAKRVIKKLERFDKTIAALIVVKSDEVGDKIPGKDVMIIPSYLEGFYTNERDFKQQRHVMLFTSVESLKAWLDGLKNPRSVPLEKIDINKIGDRDPYTYLYTREDGQIEIYLIQNVEGGSNLRALAAAQRWNKERVNPGFYTDPLISSAGVPFIVYGISQALDITPIADQSGTSETFLQIFQYPDRSYAALLPLI